MANAQQNVPTSSSWRDLIFGADSDNAKEEYVATKTIEDSDISNMEKTVTKTPVILTKKSGNLTNYSEAVVENIVDKLCVLYGIVSELPELQDDLFIMFGSKMKKIFEGFGRSTKEEQFQKVKSDFVYSKCYETYKTAVCQKLWIKVQDLKY